MALDALDRESLERDLLELDRAGFDQLARRLRGLFPHTNGNGHSGQLDLVTSAAVLPVTDGHVRAAWDVAFTTPDYPAVPPRPGDRYDELFLRQIRAMLANDRQLVAQELMSTQDPALAAGAVESSTSTITQGAEERS